MIIINLKVMERKIPHKNYVGRRKKKLATVIESVNNKFVKYLTKLNDKKYQDLEGKFLASGVHLVSEAKKSGYLEKVILLEENTEYEDTILVSENVMKKITGLKTPPSIIGLCKKIKPRKINGNVAILDNIQDPGNLGTILRTIDSCNLSQVIVSKKTVDVFNPKVLKKVTDSNLLLTYYSVLNFVTRLCIKINKSLDGKEI